MSETSQPAAPIGTPPPTNWSVGGLFLEALAQRDFAQMGECFEAEATMRALLPYGPDEFQGAPQIVSAFRRWFGGAEDFEVLDGSVGDVGDRLHVSWRLRVRPTPMGDDDWHVIEQQAYLQAGKRIDTLDLLCSGFMPSGQR
jgi:hypothetical protein